MTTSASITAARIIRQAYSLAHVLNPAEEPTGNLVQEGLDFLNETIATWGAQGIYIPYTTTLSINLVADQYIYTTSQVIADLQRAHINVQGNNENSVIPLRIVSQKEFNTFNFATSKGRPSSIFVSDDQYFSNMNDDLLGSQLYVYPVPDSQYTLQLITKLYLKELTLFESLLEFPPFYIKSLRYELANDLINQYGSKVDSGFYNTYSELKATLTSINPKDMSVNTVNVFKYGDRYRASNVYVD